MKRIVALAMLVGTALFGADENISWLSGGREVAPWQAAAGRITECMGASGGIYVSRLAIYRAADRKVHPIVITGSCTGWTQMMQIEKPGGVDPDFVRRELPRLLKRYYDADNTRGVLTKELVDRTALQLEAPGREESELLRSIYSPPMVSVSGLRWRITYMLIGYENGIWIQSFEGGLKPFCIGAGTTVVLYPNQPYLQASGLREAYRIKEAHRDLFARLPGDASP